MDIKNKRRIEKLSEVDKVRLIHNLFDDIKEDRKAMSAEFCQDYTEKDHNDQIALFLEELA